MRGSSAAPIRTVRTAKGTAPEDPQPTTMQLGDYTYNVDVDGNGSSDE